MRSAPQSRFSRAICLISVTVSVPTEQGVGFEDERGFLPVFDAAGEEDKPEAIGLRKGGFFDLAVKDDELLAEQCILGDEVGFATCEVSGSAENDRIAGRLGEVQEDLFKESNETTDQLNRPMKDGKHVVGLRERCQKLSDDCIQRFSGVKFRTDGVFSQHRFIDRFTTNRDPLPKPLEPMALLNM